jgi:hypothetical protein
MTGYWTPLALIVGVLGAAFFAASFVLEMRSRPKLGVLLYLLGALCFFALIAAFAFNAMANA